VDAAAGADDAGVADAGVVLDEVPRTLIALPPAETGRLADTPTWFPDAAPLSPLVVAALAASAPENVNPPRTAVKISPLDKILFMMDVLLR
jgi:hypothetical protein